MVNTQLLNFRWSRHVSTIPLFCLLEPSPCPKNDLSAALDAHQDPTPRVLPCLLAGPSDIQRRFTLRLRHGLFTVQAVSIARNGYINKTNVYTYIYIYTYTYTYIRTYIYIYTIYFQSKQQYQQYVGISLTRKYMGFQQTSLGI